MNEIKLKDFLYHNLEMYYGKDNRRKIKELNNFIKDCKELKKMYQSELEVFGEIK